MHKHDPVMSENSGFGSTYLSRYWALILGSCWVPTYALVNVNPTPTLGNVGHRQGISGDLSIEQAPGSGGLANFSFCSFIVVDKLWEL